MPGPSCLLISLYGWYSK